MTAPTGSRGRKRSRKEEEETPPRPTLDDLEREDQAQLTLGRAIWDQPQVAGPSRTADPGHPHAAQHEGRAAPEQAAAADRAGAVGPQQATESRGQGMLSRSATRHQGQSSITDFLSGAGQDVDAGRPDQQQQDLDKQSFGEVADLMERLHHAASGFYCTGKSSENTAQGLLEDTAHVFVGVQHRRISCGELHRALLGCTAKS